MKEIICLFVENGYDHSMGDFEIYHLWDGEKVYTEGGVFSTLSPNSYTVNASLQDYREALDWYMANTEPTHNWNKYANGGRGGYTYIGCVVKLARSRKAPNGVDLTVLDFIDGGYDDRYGHDVPNKVVVTDGEQQWTVSSSCIKEVVKGFVELPLWALRNSINRSAA